MITDYIKEIFRIIGMNKIVNIEEIFSQESNQTNWRPENKNLPLGKFRDNHSISVEDAKGERLMAGINWDGVVIFAYLSFFLIIATVMRSKIVFLQKTLIPNSIIAGLLGMLFGQYLLGVFDPAILGDYVYHLLTAAFIAMGLRGSKVKRSYGTVTTMVIHCHGYAIQGIIGLIFTLLLIVTYFPALFPSFGLHLVLGFGNNPGVAYSFGQTWEAMGFTGGAQVGLTFGALGFLWAYLVGIIIINWGVRKNKFVNFKGFDQLPRSVFTGIVKENEPKKTAGNLTTSSEAVETLALHLAVVGTVFLVTYHFLKTVTGLLETFGAIGHDLASLVGGFGFVFGILFALLARVIIDRLKIGYIIDNDIMTRLGGTFIDYMIVTAIAAISIFMVAAYWKEILALALIGGFATLGLVYIMVHRMHRDYHFERMLSSFGLLAGTVASGLALLRVVDPHFETPVAEDLVYAGGLALFTGIPILLLANIPAFGYADGVVVESIIRTIAYLTVYLAVLFGGWLIYRSVFLRKLNAENMP